MEWYVYVSYFFGGGFIANAVPHMVSGLTGRSFQTPFANPPGKGLSTARTNILWGCANLAAAYFLLVQIGNFDFHSTACAGTLGLGILLTSLLTAHIFSKLHGGDLK